MIERFIEEYFNFLTVGWRVVSVDPEKGLPKFWEIWMRGDPGVRAGNEDKQVTDK